MTPTTKAALDAAEKYLSAPLISSEDACYALHLIAEARKAEESDTTRIDWLNQQTEVDVWMRGIPQPGYMAAIFLTPQQWKDGTVITVRDQAELSYFGKTIREAIDAAMLPAPPEAK